MLTVGTLLLALSSGHLLIRQIHLADRRFFRAAPSISNLGFALFETSIRIASWLVEYLAHRNKISKNGLVTGIVVPKNHQNWLVPILSYSFKKSKMVWFMLVPTGFHLAQIGRCLRKEVVTDQPKTPRSPSNFVLPELHVLEATPLGAVIASVPRNAQPLSGRRTNNSVCPQKIIVAFFFFLSYTWHSYIVLYMSIYTTYIT